VQIKLAIAGYSPRLRFNAWLSLPGSRPCVRDLFLTDNGSTEIRRQGQRSGGVHQEEHSARERGVRLCPSVLAPQVWSSWRSVTPCQNRGRTPSRLTIVSDARCVADSEAQGGSRGLQRARAQASGASEAAPIHAATHVCVTRALTYDSSQQSRTVGSHVLSVNATQAAYKENEMRESTRKMAAEFQVSAPDLPA
jgi:hypothetical protein